MSFLVHASYINIESRTQTERSNSGSTATTYNFLFYSPEFKNYVKSFNIQENYRAVTRPFVQLAHRNLISIDYKNEYEDAPLGMKRTFYSIVFSYTLVPDLPNLPSDNIVYKGKAKAFKDPDDGSWKVAGPFENLGVLLSDRGEDNISSFLKTKYPPFTFEYTTSATGNSKNSNAPAGASGLPVLAPTGTIVNIVNGNWSGQIAQRGVRKPYMITASWNAAGKFFMATLPEYGCASTWSIENSSDKTLELREHVTKGRCLDGGLIKLNYISDTEMELSYYKVNSSKPDAEGRLRK